MSFSLFPQSVRDVSSTTEELSASNRRPPASADSDNSSNVPATVADGQFSTLPTTDCVAPLEMLRELSSSPPPLVSSVASSQGNLLRHFKSFLHKHCRESALQLFDAEGGNISADAVLEHLLPTNDDAESISTIPFWRRLCLDLLQAVTGELAVTRAEAHDPIAASRTDDSQGVSRTTPSSFVRASHAQSPPLPLSHVPSVKQQQQPRQRPVFPPSVGFPHWSPALFGTPTAMLSKADVGNEEIDGSYTINQHVVLMPLGHGTQGEVVLSMDTKKNELRAIKSIPRPKGIYSTESPTIARGALGAAKAARRQQLEREIAIMKHCRHRNLVALHEVIDDPDLDVMYLVMQYVDKGAIAKLNPDGTIDAPIDPVKLAGYTVQLCAGLSYLHRKGVIHRDIKPDNVLIGSRDDVYLADFGTSDIFRGDASHSVLGHRGTAAFMAPELLRSTTCAETLSNAPLTDDKVSGEAVDVWALGITLYVLLYGKLPWKSTRLSSLVDEIIGCDFVVAPSHPQSEPVIEFHSNAFNDASSHDSQHSAKVSPNAPKSDSSPRGSPIHTPRHGGLASQWADLLADILHPEPLRRLSLPSISARAQTIVHLHQRQDSLFSQPEVDFSASMAITSRKTH